MDESESAPIHCHCAVTPFLQSLILFSFIFFPPPEIDAAPSLAALLLSKSPPSRLPVLLLHCRLPSFNPLSTTALLFLSTEPALYALAGFKASQVPNSCERKRFLLWIVNSAKFKDPDQSVMDGNSTTLRQDNEEEEEVVEEEYVLFDLDAVMGQVHIPANAPYVLSGLDTLNPILTIDGKIKLVGEYEETLGTCLVFSESDATPMVHEQTGPSEANLFSGTCIVDNKQAPAKQVKPISRLNKILKFRLMEEAESISSTEKHTNNAIE